MFTIPLLTHAKDIIYLDIPLYNYIRNSEGTTQNFSESFYKSRKLIINLMNEYLSYWDINSNENSQLINKQFLIDIANNIPSYIQTKKIGINSTYRYLKNIATDDVFKNKYEISYIKDLRIIQRIQLLLLYRKKYKSILFIERLKFIRRKAFQIKC